MRSFLNCATLALLLPAISANAAPPAAPTSLKVNDVAAPVGTGGAVYFGWQVNDPDADEIQTRYQILVASSEEKLAAGTGDVWDSGETQASLQNHVPFSGASLKSDQRYFWKIRTWDRDGNAGPYSAPASFVVGLLENPDWSGASWIRRDSKDKDDYTYFRKKLSVPAKAVERATVYISGTHKYEFYLNGQLVGKGPAYQNPQYQYYNAFDITSLVKSGGDNQFAVLNHWFGGGQGRAKSAPGIIVKAIIHHADGSLSELGSDGTWKQSRAEGWILDQADRNKGEGVGYVECIDGAKLDPAWNTLGFDDAAWAPATVIGAHPAAPWTGTLAPDLTRIEENAITPVSIQEKGPGKYVVDLGKVYAGMPRIQFSGGTAGTVVTMRGGYVLNSAGEIPLDAKAQDTLMEYRAILNGGKFTYLPIEYVGMRYFQIDNAPAPVTKENFAFIARHSQLDPKASAFESSNTTLNGVWELMKHSIFACAQEEFVDTPTREKGGFLGDSVIQSSAAMPVLDERKLTQRAMHEFIQSMEQYWSAPENRGRINAVYPNNDGARDIPDFTQAYLTWVWKYYMETGDRAFLKDNYGRLKDVGEYMYRHQNASTGLVTQLTGGSNAYKFGIIDWPPTMRYGYDATTDPRTVINGWAYAGYDILSKIATELGDAEGSTTYRSRADALGKAINGKLLGPNGVYIDGLLADGSQSTHASQHANMFPLALGIVPPAQRNAVIEEIKKQKMSVGMVTVGWLVRALGEADQGPHLVELFTNKEWDGWARSLSLGATTTWESWNADSNKDSMSHAWGAAGLEGYCRYVLGIVPLKPQYEEVLIKPLDFADKLDWAKGKITTDRGEIAVDWKHASGSFGLRITLPVNVSARVAIPKGKAASPVVLLDGKAVPATTEGDYLVISGVGSGQHTVIRQDTAAK